VWKTPAGTQAGITGAVGLVGDVIDKDQASLNTPALSVCVLRRFPATGIVVWGGRTLSVDPEWRYISPRRMAIFLRVSIVNGIQWAVFEPNDEPLWAQLRLNLTAFMTTLFRQGAFQGSTPPRRSSSRSIGRPRSRLT
jgi:phage tail sheath protein FI